ncbi:serine/threonine protein kinase [Rubripirellula amarantea]|uniref:Serine/threonine-protein kinase PrkC n=1 Tax=Rubripirellula amarantea TaxID=2527999 RepID=A0A5C5WI75_9BACT|nr:serine/threonine-protein kinase [Rubripirellula amarantea]MDA8743948.1 serine/threonine protein kinase [Rubripirellula amarantea]TWT50267.1 Serine/threonine-protein kinase PrkC [Rubripirellula amarantea]
MQSTTRYEPNPTISYGGSSKNASADPKLLASYEMLTKDHKVSWTGHHHMLRLLGRGGQGEVYLTEYRGTDGFTVPVAMKVFSPERYAGAAAYNEAMKRVASIAAKVALIQHDNLLDVQNFIERNRIRIMMMEWVDGYDLRKLMSPHCLSMLDGRVDAARWEYINEVILTAGTTQSRFKAGVAVAIVREVLAALASLHREGIVHGDIKPANIMLKRSGHTKLIDMGSAIEVANPPRERECTPMYAAPEVLENRLATPRSDIASAGYVLVEMLSGMNPFVSNAKLRDLLIAKRELPSRLTELLPEEVLVNELLMKFIHQMISPDPNRRFPDGEAAEHVEGGAAEFHRQLVLGDMATEYDNDIRLWLEELRLMETELDDFDV